MGLGFRGLGVLGLRALGFRVSKVVTLFWSVCLWGEGWGKSLLVGFGFRATSLILLVGLMGVI